MLYLFWLNLETIFFEFKTTLPDLHNVVLIFPVSTCILIELSADWIKLWSSETPSLAFHQYARYMVVYYFKPNSSVRLSLLACSMIIVLQNLSTIFLRRVWKHLSTHGGRQDLLHYLRSAGDSSLWFSLGWSGRSAGNHIWQRNCKSGKDVCGECLVKQHQSYSCFLTLYFLPFLLN